MILVGNARAGGAGLAAHLMNVADNEHVEVHEMRGFVSDHLSGAFKEARAVSRATKCKQYLFSLSLNPPEMEDVDIDVFEDAIERFEHKLGLAGQPRAIVFHEKEGRRHAHAVWSRIDCDTLTARQLPFYKTHLNEISRDLFLENEWRLPRGYIDPKQTNPLNFALADWQQAKRTGRDPRLVKATIRHCWETSDSPSALSAALKEYGFTLAKGDRRRHVVVDAYGQVYSLARMAGVKTKQVRQRLGGPAPLPSVDDAQKALARAMSDTLSDHIQNARANFTENSGKLAVQKSAMTEAHQAARQHLRDRQTTRAEHEARQRQAQLPRGLKSVWSRLNGQYGKTKRKLEAHHAVCLQRDRHERRMLLKELTPPPDLQPHSESPFEETNRF
ncbi:MAG: relaxase/mobilization nuclease domain-containing protein [Pseudomonadota bacterium]